MTKRIDDGLICDYILMRLRYGGESTMALYHEGIRKSGHRAETLYSPELSTNRVHVVE